MKKITTVLSIILSCSIIGGLSAFPVSADEADLTIGESNVIVEELEEANSQEITDFYVDGKKVTRSADYELPEGLELSDLPTIKTRIESGTSTFNSGARAGNQAPIADLRYLILNPETLKNGYITTQTEIAFLWKFDNEYFTYDPDGDPISVYLDGIPTAYRAWLQAEGEAFDGFVVRCDEPKSYTMEFYAIDSRGARSEPFIVEIEMTYPQDYTAYNDKLQTAGQELTYTASIDHSIDSDISFCLTRKGSVNLTMTVTSSNGSIFGTKTTSDSMGKVSIPKSYTSGVEDYTISVKAKDGISYLDSEFRLEIGRNNIIGDMTNGPENAVPIKKYTTANSISATNGFIPNDRGDWYVYTADGNTTITLLSDIPGVRFKIVDLNQREDMYNSIDDSGAKRTQYLNGWSNCEKAKFELVNGVKYYIVVYSENTYPTHNKSYRLAVGDPIYLMDHVTASIPLSQSSAYQTITFNANLQSTAVVDKVELTPTTGRDMTREVKSDNEYSWHSVYGAQVRYSQSSPVRASGGWQVKIKPTSTKTFELLLGYLCEVGD